MEQVDPDGARSCVGGFRLRCRWRELDLEWGVAPHWITAFAANGGGQSAGDGKATASAVRNAKFKKLKMSGNCNAGERIISGGGIILGIVPAETIPLTRSIKTGTAANPGNGWTVSANNTTAINTALVVQAYCLQ